MENLERNNRMIAEFMGAEWKADDYGDFGFWFKEVPATSEWQTGFKIEAIKFDTSWDWLMPVVERIGVVPIQYFVSADKEIMCFIYGADVTLIDGIYYITRQHKWQYKALTEMGKIYWIEFDHKIFKPTTEIRIKPL